jgi:RNA polymerase sigma factor (sigma-70 family)
MTPSPLAGALHYIRALADTESASDEELLSRFVARRDESAFATLLGRHGPLVLGVCRQVLGDAHDAEDAFQATFFVLARKAASIRSREALPAWLHRVACNIARTARTCARQRRAHERQAALLGPPPEADMALRDWQPILHDEVDRLPAKYRVPVVLCYFAGNTHDEASRQLGCPLGTVKGRLARARDLLRTRLARRGVDLSGATVATLLAQDVASAVAPALLGHTLQAAVSFAAGPAAATQAVALAKGALQTMTSTRHWHALALVLALGAIACALAAVTGPAGQRGTTAAPLPRPFPRLDAAGGPLPPGAIARLGTVRFRHGGDVTTVVHFPGGQTVASGSRDGTVRLWSSRTGKELRRFPGSYVTQAPDGKTWASWDNWAIMGETIRLWDATGRLLLELNRPGGAITVVFSPNSKVLAVGGVSARKLNQLSLWDVATGQELPAPRMGEKYDYVYRLAFSPDGKTIATSGDDDRTVRFWDLATGKELPPLGENGRALAYSPDGRALALEGWDRPGTKGAKPVVRLFDIAARKELRRLRGLAGGIGALTFSRDGKVLVAGGGDGLIRCWETASGKELGVLAGHQDAVTSLALSPDGKTLASGSRDRTVRLWAMATGKPLHACPGHQGEVCAVALSPDGKTVISAGWDKTIRLWDLASRKEVRRLADQAPVRCLALAPDGKVLASRSWSLSGEGAMLRLWDVATGKERQRFSVENVAPTIAFSPDGRCLASSSFRSVSLLDVVKGEASCRADVPREQPAGDIPFIAFSPDGKTFAWVSYSTCRVSETATGKELHRFAFFRAPRSLASISWAAFSRDGRTLLLETEGAYCVWDVAGRKELRRFPGGPAPALSAALSPDGKVLATGGADGTVRLWEVATGKERRKFQGHQGSGGDPGSPCHQGGVGALAWSSDGKLLVSGGADTAMLVWDVSGALK